MGIHRESIDSIYATCFVGNKDRHNRLLREIDRVGLQSPHVIWGFRTPYEKFILGKIPHIRELDTHPGSWGVTLSHYRAIKTAHGLGAANALIVEDDCRFLKDSGAMWERMSSAPDDYDFLMLDSFGNKGEKDSAFNGWTSCRRCYSTACYLINRRAMEVLIDMYESPVSGKFQRPMMRNSDHWTDNGIIGDGYRIYCATPNVAVQCRCPGPSNYGEVVFNQYRTRGIKLDNYMPY